MTTIEPTPAEIKAACDSIRERWTPQEHLLRRNFTVVNSTYTGCGKDKLGQAAPLATTIRRGTVEELEELTVAVVSARYLEDAA